jgi:putative ABC transport system permease protein
MFLSDIRYAGRMLHKTPVFTVAAVLTLALGIGANTAIFTVVNAVLLRPLPFSEPDRLVRIFEKNDKLNLPTFSSSVLNYLSWKEQARTIERMGIIGFTSFNLTGGGEPEQFNGSPISPSLLPLLGIQPLLGRSFRAEEEKPGSPPVAMISEALWRRRFGADATLMGKPITLNGIGYTLVGIAPQSLHILTGGDILVPLTIDPGRENRLNHVTLAVGRLKHGTTLTQAQTEMDLVTQRIGLQYPEVKDWGIRLMTFDHWLVADQLRAALWVLLGAVGFVLLIACANVANLLLSRAASRQTEIAVRTALGASRARLIRQLLTESLLLSMAGGVSGILGATWAVQAMLKALPPDLLPVSDVGVDSTVLLVALTMTVLTGVVFGLAPAWQTAKTDLNTVLKQGGRSGAAGARPILRKALIGGEFALATVLLTGAGLLMQSLLRLQQAPLGFRSEHLLTFQLSPSPAKYAGIVKTWALYKSLLESVRTLPGVRGAEISSGIPMGAGNYTTSPAFPVGKSILPAGTGIPIDWRVVSPGFFQAMDIPLLSGRYFDEHDTPAAPPVMVVSKKTVEKFWGSDNPLGRVLRLTGNRVFSVVGVVGDVRNTSLDREPGPAMYIPSTSRALPLMDVVVRTEGDPKAAISGVRRKLRELDPELPMSNVKTMQQWLSNNAAQARLNSALLEGFAFIALLIAAIGIYGVLSYSVNQRLREIGVRLAIGAQPGDVLRLVVSEGMLIAAVGIGAGLIGALAVSRVMATLLYGIEARDPATFLAVALVLSVVAIIASYLPALRAARVDPIVALRYE